MKQIILSLIAFIGAILNACMAKDIETSETRNLSGYTSIHIDGVSTINFTQGDDWACRVEGRAEEVADLVTTVKNGTLTIGHKDKKRKSRRGTDIYLTAPRLEAVTFDGVGQFNCEKTLNADDIRFTIDGVGALHIEDLRCRSVKLEIDGVGKGNVHVDCETLNALIDGVGTMTLSGHADHANIKKDGIGHFSTRRLKVGE